MHVTLNTPDMFPLPAALSPPTAQAQPGRGAIVPPQASSVPDSGRVAPRTLLRDTRRVGSAKPAREDQRPLDRDRAVCRDLGGNAHTTHQTIDIQRGAARRRELHLMLDIRGTVPAG